MEDDESTTTSRVGKAVPASAIGLSSEQWDKSLEIEAYLDHPFQIKQAIEHPNPNPLASHVHQKMRAWMCAPIYVCAPMFVRETYFAGASHPARI